MNDLKKGQALLLQNLRKSDSRTVQSFRKTLTKKGFLIGCVCLFLGNFIGGGWVTYYGPNVPLVWEGWGEQGYLEVAESNKQLAAHIEIVELLIARGADLEAKDVDGLTSLHRVVGRGHKEIAELLIAKGADLEARRMNGWTPLHAAAKKGQKEIVELLIDAGADVNAKDDGGDTPLDKTINFNRTEIADLLRKHGGKIGEEVLAEEGVGWSLWNPADAEDAVSVAIQDGDMARLWWITSQDDWFSILSLETVNQINNTLNASHGGGGLSATQ